MLSGIERPEELADILRQYHQVQHLESPTRRTDASSSWDTSNVPAAAESFADYRDLNKDQLLKIDEIAHRAFKLSRSAINRGNHRNRVYYEKLARCLYRATGHGINFEPQAMRHQWLAETVPPDNSNEALSQALRSMSTLPDEVVQYGPVRTEMQGYADEIRRHFTPRTLLPRDGRGPV
jgi:hypothetical protein